MTAVERSDWHARAARLLCAQGADADLIANHLMFVAPAGDQQVVDRLRTVAEMAVRRGAGEAAAAYLSRALTEPVHALERPATLAELGRAETLTRDPAAIEHLEQARTLARDPVERARYTYDLASVLVYVGQWDGVLTLLTEAIRELGEQDPALRLRLAALRLAMTHHPSWAANVDGQLPYLLELAAEPEPEAREPRLHLGLLLAVRGKRCELVRGLISGGLDAGKFVADEGSASLAAASAVHALAYLDELDWARETAESLLADARRRGSVLGFVNGIGTRALVALRAGAIAEAEADARACVDLTREHGMALVDPFAVGYLATALLERGERDEAEALVTDAHVPDHFAGMPGWATLLEARARVQHSCGDLAGARKIWSEVGDLWTRCQVMNPNVTSWRSELALLTRDDVATSLILVEAELVDARQAGSARALGIALRARGLVRGGQPGIEDLTASAGELESTPAALEHARTLVELGAALRRANRRSDAREPLARGREIAHSCGALVLCARADAELRATGARPRRLAMTGRDSLTPSERRVAELAVGLSSQEIAQELFVTINTVESHLRRAYAKLGIHSRRELRAALGHT
jgi:DNA-binding CsgD family transcriptional regulator